MNTAENFEIRPARSDDVRLILELIRDLATYGRAPDEVTATQEQLVDVLFGERPDGGRGWLAFEGESPAWASRFTFIISPPGSGGPAFTSNICS